MGYLVANAGMYFCFVTASIAGRNVLAFELTLALALTLTLTLTLTLSSHSLAWQ